MWPIQFNSYTRGITHNFKIKWNQTNSLGFLSAHTELLSSQALVSYQPLGELGLNGRPLNQIQIRRNKDPNVNFTP